MKYLTTTTDVYRVDTVEEVERLHEELRNSKEFSLLAFSYRTKTVKAKGEIIDEYQLVTVKKGFNDEKDPDAVINIVYEVE